MQRITFALAICAMVPAVDVAAQSSETTAVEETDVVVNGEYRSLTARYALSNGTYIDPPPDAKIDRFVLSIRGKDAERIYRSMAVPEQRTDCHGNLTDNSARKVAGGFECHRSDRNGYSCDVAIVFETGATEPGYACDN